MDGLNILHVIPTFSSRYGGPVSALMGLVHAQSIAGNNITIVTTNRDYPRGKLRSSGRACLKGSEVDVQYFSCQIPSYYFSFSLAFFLKKHIRDFDIVHVWTLYRYPTAIACRMARKYGVPYVVRPCGALEPPLREQSAVSLPMKIVYERLIEWKNIKHASAINAVTITEAINMPSFVSREKIFTLGNGINWFQYKKLPARGAFRAAQGLSDAPLVLFLGRINFKKGLDLLIPAFDVLQRKIPDVRLAIVGPENDDYGQKVRDWVSERGLIDAVCFVEHLDGVAVLQAYVDADVFVLPSYTENFGMTVVEAMACGLPVVISDQVNIHTEVEESGAGLVTRCNAAEVTEALDALLRDAPRRQVMGAAGRAFAQQQYNWDRIVVRLTEEYKAAIERHHRSAADTSD